MHLLSTPTVILIWYVASSRICDQWESLSEVHHQSREIRRGQSQVFQTDVSSLRKEFDLQVLKQFISKYNYSAALDLLNNSDLTIEPQFKNAHSSLL